LEKIFYSAATLRIFFLGTTLALLFSCLAATAYVGNDLSRTISGYRISFRDYSWKGESGVIFQIFKNKRKLLERRGHSLFIFDIEKQGESFGGQDNRLIKCADLTGDGIVDLVVQEWSGGAYCCYKYDIYSLGREFKHIWHHDAVYGHLNIICRAKKRAVLVVEDTTFCNFNSIAECGGAKPKVHLIWGKDSDSISKSKARSKAKLEPSFCLDRAATIFSARAAAGALEAATDNPDNSVLDPQTEIGAKHFIELIYGGQTAKALAKLDSLKPEQRRHYLRSFFETFRKSRFYFDVLAYSDKAAIAKMKMLAK